MELTLERNKGDIDIGLKGQLLSQVLKQKSNY